MGTRVQQVQDQMSDADLTELVAGMRLIQREITAINQEHLPRLQKGLDKLNGSVGELRQQQADQDKRLSLVEQFNEQQVKPVLGVAQNNRLEIVKMTAKYAAVIGVGGGGLGALGIWLAQLLTS